MLLYVHETHTSVYREGRLVEYSISIHLYTFVINKLTFLVILFLYQQRKTFNAGKLHQPHRGHLRRTENLEMDKIMI